MNTVTPAELTARLEKWSLNTSSAITSDEAALRQAFADHFPLSTLMDLPLDQYVMGHGDQDNYCYWLEHKTRNLGSILGGTAAKFGVYWSEDAQDYVVGSRFTSAEDARQRILGAIVKAAERLVAGQFTEADAATADMGENKYSMRLKPLALYFPQLLLPITNPTHLQHFLRVLGQEPAGGQLAMNHQLLSYLRTAARDMDTLTLMRFLYDSFPPPMDWGRRVWKIALGEQAKYLAVALEHGVIFIGSHLANLKGIPKGLLAAELQQAGQDAGFASSAHNFTNNIQPGDIIVANKGMNRVMGVGIVDGDYLEPEADSNPLTADVLGDLYPVWAHARRVTWVLTTPVDLPQGVKKLAIQTVTQLKEDTLQRILDVYAQQASSPEQRDRLKQLGWKEPTGADPIKPNLPLVDYLLDLAQLSKNIILYGPPGTGKTFIARQFAQAQVRNSELLTDGSPAPFTPEAWWQAAALALAELQSAKVSEIQRHPVVQKFSQERTNANVYQTLWQMLEKKPDVFARVGDADDQDRAVWQLTQEGHRQVSGWQEMTLPMALASETSGLVENVTFHPAFVYEEFIEGLRPTRSGGFEVRDGVFKRLCQRAHAHPEQQFVLLIDEINRADTAKTFGELITLIEDDKRVEPGTLGDHPATLPYSEASDNLLSVPSNLYLVGTMNTADRSITLMDVALRRRFTFVEVPPMPELLSGKVDGTALSPERLLRQLNYKLTELLGKDHQIGHAYLMGETLTAHDLTFRWRHKIIPLLQEYFYARDDGFRELLGESLYRDAIREQPLDQTELMKALLQFTDESDHTLAKGDNGVQ